MMKKILIITIVFYCTLTFSCKKDSHNPTNELFIGATKKGSNWVVKYPGTNYIADKDTLVIYGVKGEESIAIKIPFHGVGTYPLKVGQVAYYTTVGGDAISSWYQPDTAKINTLTVTSFNAYTDIVKGDFELNLKKTQGAASLDTALSFTNGKLWIQIPGPTN